MRLWFLNRLTPARLTIWNRLRFSTIPKKRQRIIALDILRGLFLVSLIVNHLPWTPSIYSFITGRGELFASAAEGFFVVSGILVGYIYGQKIIGSPRQTFKRIWKRGLLLYLLSVGGTLIYTLLALWPERNLVGLEVWNKGIGSYLLNTFTLRYSYGWIDFLNRYALFMLVAPFALWLVSRGKAWIVLLLSFILWLSLGSNSYFMPFSAWQLIFMAGLVIGFYLPEIEDRVMKIAESTRTRLFRGILTAALITYIVGVYWSVTIPLDAQAIGGLFLQLDALRESLWDPWFSKPSLGFGRLLIGTLWFVALYTLVRTFEDKLVYVKLIKIFERLGQHSLFVYVTHGIVILFINAFLSPPENYSNILLNTIIVTLALWLIYEATMRREIFDKFITRTRHRINREDF